MQFRKRNILEIVFIGMSSLYLQYQFGARVPSIVDQAQRQATFILSFGEPLQHSRSPPLSGWSRPSIRPMNLYECSARLSSMSLIPFPTSSSLLFSLSLSLALSFSFSRSLSLSPSSFTLILHLLSFRSYISVTRTVERLLEFLLRSQHRCLFVRLSREMDRPCRLLLRIYGICATELDRSCYRSVMRRDPFVVTISLISTAIRHT